MATEVFLCPEMADDRGFQTAALATTAVRVVSESHRNCGPEETVVGRCHFGASQAVWDHLWEERAGDGRLEPWRLWQTPARVDHQEAEHWGYLVPGLLASEAAMRPAHRVGYDQEPVRSGLQAPVLGHAAFHAPHEPRASVAWAHSAWRVDRVGSFRLGQELSVCLAHRLRVAAVDVHAHRAWAALHQEDRARLAVGALVVLSRHAEASHPSCLWTDQDAHQLAYPDHRGSVEAGLGSSRTDPRGEPRVQVGQTRSAFPQSQLGQDDVAPLGADDPSRHALAEVRYEEANPVVRCVRLGAQAGQVQLVAFLACSEEHFRRW